MTRSELFASDDMLTTLADRVLTTSQREAIEPAWRVLSDAHKARMLANAAEHIVSVQDANETYKAILDHFRDKPSCPAAQHAYRTYRAAYDASINKLRSDDEATRNAYRHAVLTLIGRYAGL